MPAASSSFWTRQHGWPPNLAHIVPQRCSLTAIDASSCGLGPTIRLVQAVVVDASGRPRLAEVPEPEGPGEPVRIVACGLCGSDLEKLRPGFAGTVLGHEV